MPKFREFWFYENIEDRWVNIFCPLIDDKKGSESLGIKRKIYKEFKELEKFLEDSVVFIGWVAWTHLENAHIMGFFAKVGSRPYDIELKENKLWFCKEFKTR